jgi:hypothetical protein
LAIPQSGPVVVTSFGAERCKVLLDDRNLVMLLPKAVLPDRQRLRQNQFGVGDPVWSSEALACGNLLRELGGDPVP